MTNLPRGITLINEDVYEDGNYSNLIRHFGLKFTVHFVNGEVRVHSLNGAYCHVKRHLWDSSIKAVRDFTVARIREQGPAFIAAHKALYGVAEVSF